MTVVEKAAYLKGLTDGLGIDPESKEGKLWNALCDLVSDMAHEIEDLQDTSMDYADTLDEIGDELSYLEKITCDLDMPKGTDNSDDDDFSCDGNCSLCSGCGEYDDSWDDDDEYEEVDYDGVIYDVKCPKCGEEITFDEKTLDMGSTVCPKCGETLEFDLDSLEDKKDDGEMPF